MIREGRPAVASFASELTEKLAAAGATLVDPGDEGAQMVVAVGGDGTMLAASRIAYESDIPVLGFNLGTLGFLTAAEPAEADAVVAALMSGDYGIEERSTVTARIAGSGTTGLNDVVIEKVDTTRLVSLDIVVDGVPLMTQRADGLIVATPTGSTAYSFSAGGPLIDPVIDALVITPVASHSLFDRSVVVPGASTIEVTVNLDRRVRVNVDKEAIGELVEGETVEIESGDRPIQFVTLGDRPFPSVIGEKFGL